MSRRNNMMLALQSGKYNICNPSIINTLRNDFGYSPNSMVPKDVLSKFNKMKCRSNKIPLCSKSQCTLHTTKRKFKSLKKDTDGTKKHASLLMKSNRTKCTLPKTNVAKGKLSRPQKKTGKIILI